MSGVVFVGDGESRSRTAVVIWILRYLQQQRVNPAYFRFASMGVDSIEQSEAAEVSRCCHLGQELSEMVKYCYRSTGPVYLVARQEHLFIDPKVIAQQYAWNLSTHDHVLVDSLGTVTAPLVLERSRVVVQEDLIRSLRLNVVWVTTPSAASLETAMMVSQYCIGRRLPWKGIILTQFDENNYYHRDFLASVEFLTKSRVFALLTEKGLQIRADLSPMFAEPPSPQLY